MFSQIYRQVHTCMQCRNSPATVFLIYPTCTIGVRSILYYTIHVLHIQYSNINIDYSIKVIYKHVHVNIFHVKHVGCSCSSFLDIRSAPYMRILESFQKVSSFVICTSLLERQVEIVMFDKQRTVKFHLIYGTCKLVFQAITCKFIILLCM